MSTISQIHSSMMESLDDGLKIMEFSDAEFMERAQLARRILSGSVDWATCEKIRQLLSAQRDGRTVKPVVADSSGAEVAKSRLAKIADAAWVMRAGSQRYANPELQPYIGKHVAVYEQKIVAFGDNYTEVLQRAATECGVPTHRIIVDYWGNPARFQLILEDEDV